MVDLGAGTLSFLQGERAGWGGKGRHQEEQDGEGEQNKEKVRRRSTKRGRSREEKYKEVGLKEELQDKVGESRTGRRRRLY